jgi:hypothetical protein
VRRQKKEKRKSRSKVGRGRRETWIEAQRKDG